MRAERRGGGARAATGRATVLRRAAALVRASHPEPVAAVTTVSALLAVAIGLRWSQVALVTGTVLASQLATGWSNDAIDAARDASTGRRDKPIPSGDVSRRTVVVGSVLACLATVALALPCGPAGAAAIIGALAVALLYNWPLKSTVFSVVPYAVSFAALPTFVALAGGRAVPGWLPAAGALLGAGAHFANVLPDLADDARTGIRGLPHRVGATASMVATVALLVAATGVLAFGPPGAPLWPGWLACATALVVLPVGLYRWRLRRGAGASASRAPFRAVMIMVLVDIALLLLGGSGL